MPDSTPNMTNIEAIPRRERRRMQNNYPVVPFRYYQDDLYLAPRYPEPGLDSCEAYEPADLVIKNGAGQDFQELLDEDPKSDPHVVELRRLVSQWKARRADYKRLLSAEYNRLIVQCIVVKDYWHAGPVKRRWRKPWFEKRWVGWRWVMKKQYLKPRVIAYRALVSFDLATGRKTYEIRRKTIRPYRWVEVRKPKYVWKLKRPGGLVPYKPRVCSKRPVTDWAEVRRLFAAFKLSLIPHRLETLNLRQRIFYIRRFLIRQPRLASGSTTSGLVAPPTTDVPVLLPYAGNLYSLDYQSGLQRYSFPGFLHEGTHHPQVGVHSVQAWAYGESLENAYAMAQERAYCRGTAAGRTHLIEMGQCALMLGDRRHVRLTAESERMAEKATVAPEKELRAYASIKTLTKAGDYTFQIVRSIGELKDTRATFKQAKDFLRWLKHPKVRVLATKKGYVGLAGIYLAWKFAIQPTIQDVNTVIDNTVSYLTDIRRSLRGLVEDLQSGSSIYHARAAYATGGGVVSGRLKLNADNGSFGEFNYSLDWTRRYKHPLPVCLRHASDSDDLSDIHLRVLHDPEGRGAELVSMTGNTADYQCHIEEESNDGQKWHRRFNNDLWNWIYGGDPYATEESKREAVAFANHVQQLHPFAFPYDVRDIATGVLFASYHAGDIVRLATDGRVDLGTITDFMDQTVALESWLKNQDAQRAAGLRLLKHTDYTFVTWELTPLSFVYDWFTTSGTVVEALNSLARENLEVIPQPLYGVWQSERHELLSVVPNLRLKERSLQELVREWTMVGVSRDNVSNEFFFAAPARSTIFYDTVWEPSPGTAVFSRTGLYRFRRGEYEPQGLDKLDAYLPRLRLDLNADKLVTLSAMLGGFA